MQSVWRAVCAVSGWAVFLLVMLGIFALVALLYCVCRALGRRRRGEKGGNAGGAGAKGADGKRGVGAKLGGGLGGTLGKERVQPELDELTAHMEENERAGAEAAGGKDEKTKKQLGKLQYSVEYDFQKGEVRVASSSSSQAHFNYSSCTRAAHGEHHPGGGPGRDGPRRHQRPVRQGVPAARQEEEVRDQSAPQDTQPGVQRELRVQGARPASAPALPRRTRSSSALPLLCFCFRVPLTFA